MTPPTVQFIPAPAAGGADDTYTASNATWFSLNGWYRSFHVGSWTSTGTTDGDFALIDSGSVVGINFFRVEAASNDVQLDDFCDVSLNGGAIKRATWNGTTAGNGDYLFDWDDGTFTTAEIGPGGTFGWDENDLLIEYNRP